MTAKSLRNVAKCRDGMWPPADAGGGHAPATVRNAGKGNRNFNIFNLRAHKKERFSLLSFPYMQGQEKLQAM